MFEPIRFTYQETQTLLSSLRSRQVRLKASGDYPEQEQDKILMEKLIKWATTSPDDINVATRAPQEK